ncbi:MAG: aryl-sulfate sulfotransferase [Candidatus Kryptoniota bacterium]
MITSDGWGHFRFLLALSLFACGVLQGATLTLNGTSRRRAEPEGKQPEIGLHIVYVSPMPSSKYNTPETNIIIRCDEDLSRSTIQNGLFDVVGSSSGRHDGNAILSTDHRTIVFQPETLFSLSETVSVSLAYGIRSINGDTARLVPFEFTISNTDLNSNGKLLSELRNEHPNSGVSTMLTHSSAASFGNPGKPAESLSGTTSLPSDFPTLTVTKSNNPSPGFIFINTNMDASTDSQYGNYLIIADNTGNPIFYRNTGAAPGWDFNIQPTGVLTYGYNNYGMHYIMNTSLQVIDSVTCGNGYINDSHELRILPNGNIFLLADDYENIDMSKIVKGGNPNATVLCNSVQELDSNRDVIFQWRAIDHLNVANALGQDLTQPQLDPFHCNSIEIDPDGNILLSIRHFSAIIKINVETDSIMWQLGGTNNQFKFVNDPIGFSYQHSVRRLSNGDITLFDNGDLHTSVYSRAVEYKLDTVNMTATLEWQYSNNPFIYGEAMGYVQRLADGNTLIGWGYDEGDRPAVTEVEPNGSIALEMHLPDNVYSYRAYRYPFLFITAPTLIDTVKGGSYRTLRWNSSGVDSVNVDCSIDGGNSWVNAITDYPADDDSLTVQIPDNAASSFEFRLTESGKLDDGLTFVSEPIAVGSVNAIKQTSHFSYSLSPNYPNPFNPSTIINYQVPSNGLVTIKVYDVLGREMETLVNDVKSPGEYTVRLDGGNLSSGVYFYRMTAGSYVSTKKALLIK